MYSWKVKALVTIAGGIARFPVRVLTELAAGWRIPPLATSGSQVLRFPSRLKELWNARKPSRFSRQEPKST